MKSHDHHHLPCRQGNHIGFPSQNKCLKIKAGHVLTGEVADGFLYFFTEFGPARMPLVLVEEVK